MDGVLLLRLYEKTSTKGNTYFAGRLGAASVVMMRDMKAEGDDPVWQVFVSEPRQSQTAQSENHGRPATAPIATPSRSKPFTSTPRNKPKPVPPGELDDALPI